jgi:hypothetical protein
MAATFHQVNTFKASPKRIHDILMRPRERAMNRERKSRMIPEAVRTAGRHCGLEPARRS